MRRIKRYAIITGILAIGALAGMSIPRTEAQVPVQTQHDLEIVSREAQLWRFSQVIEEQHALIMAATKIVNERKDVELTRQFKEAGFQVFDVVTGPEKPKE